MSDITSNNNYYKVFFNMIEEVEEFVSPKKGGTFLISNVHVCTLLQDSAHFFLTPIPTYTGSRIWKCGRFMDIDLYVDSTMNVDDYRLIHRYGKSNAREIIIDKLLNKETYDKILDLSHYKTIIK